MGRPLAVNGTFDRATAREVAGLWAAVGVTERRDLPLEGVLWLPAPSVAPATCSMPIGDDVKAGDVLFSTGGTLSALRLVLPEQVLPGARVAILDNLSAPISAGSIVLENKFVAAYSAQPAVRQWLADTSAEAKLTVATRLAAPISAVAVPASALFRLDADAGCVLDNGAPKRVRIVASEFGSTLVTAANLPTRVRVQAPANGPSCG